MPRHLIELSHVITAGMITYPGLPGPEITPHLTPTGARLHAAPLRIARFGTVPVRAYACLPR